MTESIATKRIEEYFDKDEMQAIQNAFSDANHCYFYFIDRNKHVVTDFVASYKEKAYIEERISQKQACDFVQFFSDRKGEEIIDYPTSRKEVMVRGVAARAETEALLGVWVLIGFDEAHRDEEMTIAGVKTTNVNDFDHASVLLQVWMSHYFSNKCQLVALKDNIASLEAEGKRVDHLIKKTSAMTEILRIAESDDDFTDVMERVLCEAGAYLQVSNAHLLQMDADDVHVYFVCEWAAEEKYQLADRLAGLYEDDYPFMNGRPYTISSDTPMPENFTEYFSRNHFSCGAFLPITVNERLDLYLCFVTIDTKRKWTVEDINFINDVKRVIQNLCVKHEAMDSLVSAHSTLEIILENLGCGVLVVDESQHILYENASFKSIQLQDDEVTELEEIIFAETKDEPVNFHAKNSDQWFEISYTDIEWVDGKSVSLISLYDISEIKQEYIDKQANVDYLTGLYSRHKFEEDLEEELRRANLYDGNCALLYIGIDDFSNINNSLGRHAGDEVLKNVAQALRLIPGVQDACYRIGGDEFILLVRNEYAKQVDTIIADVQRAFRKPWRLENVNHYLTMSMGVVLVPQDGTDSDLLMQRVAIALHTAKVQGKNRVEYYNSQQLYSAVERFDLETCMRNAVANGCEEFEVNYQPIVNVHDENNACCGAEALIRWNSPILGKMQPSQFIPLAEELGLINQIGEHVLKEATKRCKYWNDFGHPEYKVNVNLSVVQLMQEDIVNIIKDALDTSGLNPANLTIEVTESFAIHDMNYMQNILGQIKALGVRVALDDFGTGYSSLNHLRSLPIDVIKIDKCFIDDIGEDEFSDVFVKSVSEIADTLDMKICVEGVEKEQQKSSLNDIDVDMIQGYLFDKPLTADAFEEKYLF